MAVHSLSQALKSHCIPKEMYLGNLGNSIFLPDNKPYGGQISVQQVKPGRTGVISSQRERSCQQLEATEAALIQPQKDRKWTSKCSPQRWHMPDMFCSSCSCPGKRPQCQENEPVLPGTKAVVAPRSQRLLMQPVVLDTLLSTPPKRDLLYKMQ